VAYQVRSGALNGFDTLVRKHGGNPMSLLEQLGMNPSILRDPEILIPYTKFAELLELGAATCEEECFGIQLAMGQGIEVLGPLGLAALGQDNLLDCLGALTRFLYLHAQGAEGVLIELDDKTLLRFTVHFPIDIIPTQLFDHAISLCYRVMETLNGGRPLARRILLQRRASPTIANCFAELFQCEVDFGATDNGLLFNTADLAKPPQLQRQLQERYLEQNVLRMDRLYPNELPQQVRYSIRQLLPIGECTVTVVASLLGINVRTLQQRLKSDGTSFRVLLDTVRKELAMDYLQYSPLDITEIALLLGYSELPVFSRVFKTWMGESPRAWRKKFSQ